MILSTAIVVLFGITADAIWLLHGDVVPWDAKNHFYAMFRFLGDQLAKGELPFWNPYHFAGHPSAADPQSLVFSPTMVLFALLAPKASMQVFDAVIMAHLVFGGLGTLALFRQRNWAAPGAVLAAMIYMIGGSASARLQHTGMILSYSFFPFCWYFMVRALREKSYGAGLTFSLLAALMAQGRDQVAFLFCLWLIAALVWEITQAERPLVFLRSRIWLILTMGFAGLALLAIPCLLTLQFLAQSNRPSFAYGVAAEGSLSVVNFLTLAIPNFFGSLDWNYDYWGPGYATMPNGDWTDRAINYLFIGSFPTLLLLWIGIARRHIFDRDLRLILWIGICTIFYALGRETPAFEWIFDHVPGVALYRRPADATFAMNMCFALMAGHFANLIAKNQIPATPRGLWTTAWPALTAVLVVSVIGLALDFAFTQKHFASSLDSLIRGSVVMVFIVAIVVWGRGTRHAQLMVLVLIGVTGVELLMRNAASSVDAEPAHFYAPYDHLPADQQQGLDMLRAAINAAHDRGEYPRVEIIGLSGAWMNASMVFGLEDTVGYNPLRIADYERAVGPGDNAGDISLRHFPENFRGYQSKLARLLGLEYLVLGEPLPKLPRHVPRPVATLMYSAKGMYIYKLRPPYPRAYLATESLPVDSEAIADGEALPDFDASRTTLIDKSDIIRLQGHYPATPVAAAANTNVRISAYHANSVTLVVDTDRAGILVLHDIYYPGWEVTVDNTPMPLLRTNVLFRGVEITSGHHVVRFDYRPLSVKNLVAALRALLKQHAHLT